MADKAILNVQHAEPSVYYCYKFWFSTGEVEEGCTDVMTSKNLFLDPNEYGWVYMTVPIVGLFLLVLIFYVLCGTGKNSKSNLPPAEPDVMSEIAVPTYRAAAPPYQTNPRGLYSVIPMDTFNQAQPKPRIYPTLPNGSRKQPNRRETQEKKPKKSVEAEPMLDNKHKEPARRASVDTTSSIEELEK